ncbi:IS701 family transposase [Neochlamydia sp. S13]|uniref:IS701 family transposase n=1 Tax=Neochlamydia sp. S13 TaxID=1353976 RepID=UPI000FD184C9|nr:IS701 family transposase [Neochlamydia sp. S13]BBI17256.1 Mobile element protein [Neochlamydia sp. S13]BBI18356.1 Mobile element protein [Neochlamydia sp. S13]
MELKAINQTIKQKKEELALFLRPFFSREEARQVALQYTWGLMSKAERKNTWQLAEEAGLQTPYAFQHLLRRGLWQADAIRDRLQMKVLKDKEGDILAIDETGFLKKGKHSVGVARQYSGTAGRIENCQVGVFLSYATNQGHVLIDRELYIPEEWFLDEERRARAGIPKEVKFKTKIQLAMLMLQRAFGHGIRPSWVVGDEVYGVYPLRAYLEKECCPYILAVPSNYHVSVDFDRSPVSHFLAKIKPKDWQSLSAGKGAKGERYYHWYRLEVNSDSPEGWTRWLLLRRNMKDPRDVAYYIACCPNNVTLQDMVKAAGSRWTIEGAPQAHKEVKHELKALCISCTNDGEDPPKSVFRNGLQTTLSCCY